MRGFWGGSGGGLVLWDYVLCAYVCIQCGERDVRACAYMYARTAKLSE